MIVVLKSHNCNMLIYFLVRSFFGGSRYEILHLRSLSQDLYKHLPFLNSKPRLVHKLPRQPLCQKRQNILCHTCFPFAWNIWCPSAGLPRNWNHNTNLFLKIKIIRVRVNYLITITKKSKL